MSDEISRITDALDGLIVRVMDSNFKMVVGELDLRSAQKVARLAIEAMREPILTPEGRAFMEKNGRGT